MTVRTTEPSAANATLPCWTRNSRPYVGEIARRIPGWWATDAAPATARIVNHTAITGPKRRPTTPVPKRWIANRTVMITSVISTTIDSRLGETTFSPSTADSTEIAGVIMPSP